MELRNYPSKEHTRIPYYVRNHRPFRQFPGRPSPPYDYCNTQGTAR